MASFDPIRRKMQGQRFQETTELLVGTARMRVLSENPAEPSGRSVRQRYSFGSAQSVANLDVTKDGQRFLMAKNDLAGSRLNVVLNWFEELKQRVPSK
jgi:hypothetical protein